MRLLFVDDEPQLLASLRTTFRRRRHDWQISFAEGGASALRHLEAMAFDVVVTDLRMQDIDGFEVLRRSRELHPQAARIVLTASTDLNVTQRALRLAHQILGKPCDAEALRMVIESTVSTLDLLKDSELRRVAGESNELPPLPHNYAEFAAAVDSGASPRDLATIIARDPLLSAGTLRLVNSSYFASGGTTTRIDRAVSLLGVDLLKCLYFQVNATHVFAKGLRQACLDPVAVQEHGVKVGRLAAAMMHDEQDRREAQTLGVLHEIGKFVLAHRSPLLYRNILHKSAAQRISTRALEREVFSHSHCEVGAYLLGLWGLPFSIVHGVLHQERPSSSNSTRFGPLGAVHISNALVSQQEMNAEVPDLDDVFIEQFCLRERVEIWKNDMNRMLYAAN